MSSRSHRPHRSPSPDGQHPLLVELVSSDPDTLVVVPVGEADLSTADRLRQALEKALDTRRPNVIVDLDRLSFMDATTLGVLAEARARACAAGGRLQVRCRSSLVREMLSLTGMDEIVIEHSD